MVKGNGILAHRVITILILAIAFMGCGGGGGSSESAPNNPPGSPSQQVLPASYDFGTVTVGNTPAPLEVKIKNNGSANLIVSSIVLSDLNNFSLNLNGGSSPCGTSSPTVPAGNTCTFEVGFQPVSLSTFSPNVQVASNDGSTPLFVVQINGTSDHILGLTVRINQIETACPVASNEVTAYVSVTDQAGYPLTGLTINDFSVVEDTVPIDINTFNFVAQVATPVSIVALMDYSSSVTDFPEIVRDMEQGLITLVDNLGASDRAEIIKFDSEFSIVQAFTSDKAALRSAIVAPFDMGPDTRLFDSVYRAVDDAGLEVNNRRAVIVLSDGYDIGSNGQLSTHTLDQVILNATDKGVPIFTILIGDIVSVTTLTRMADETGGQLFEALNSDNLKNIYQQISSILFENQYVLQFDQLPKGAAGVPGNLTIRAISSGQITGNDTRQITSCQ